jgi:hypothetical protein
MKSAKTQRSSCCAFFSALLLEIFAWGLAVVAITTSFWLGAACAARGGGGAVLLRCAHKHAHALAAPLHHCRDVPAARVLRGPLRLQGVALTRGAAHASLNPVLAPTREALPGVSHAGLWLSCGVPPADALAPPPPPPSDLLDAAQQTIQASIRNVKADVASALRTTASARSALRLDRLPAAP